ncbi:hypothetical protein GQR58_010630 [Nymphon striatum]|nr:hypothetical protein GQR58_010630 [Nymphon striatum]
MEDNKLYVIFNGNPVLEFDRTKPVPGKQRQYLDNMDTRMNTGIQLGNDFIEVPNVLQRSQFVANSLVNALLKENDTLAVAMCTYLAKRMPDLQQIQCKSEEDQNEREATDSPKLSIEFVYDRNYEKAQQEQTIQFFKPDEATKH